MKNKKLLMTVSAFMILFFHLWIYIFPKNNVEIFLKQICFIGVDIFFFVSAYSIGKKDKINYKEFIKNRFTKIYIKFIVFAFIAFIYQKWQISRFFKVIVGYEFITRGGGSFLWFIPAIMIMYLLLPLYKKIDDKYKIMTSILTVTVYLLMTVLVSLLGNYRSIIIFTNRIPIILIGYYFSKYNLIEKLKMKRCLYAFITTLLLIFGSVLAYKTLTSKFKLSIFPDIFYLTAIPLIIGLILLLDKVPTNKITDFLGSFTLEVYAIQMIFGFNIANDLYSRLNSIWLTNFMSITIVLVLSYIINRIFKLVENIINNLYTSNILQT